MQRSQVEKAAHKYVSVEYLAASVDKFFFVAPEPCRVIGIEHRVTVQGSDGGAVNLMIEKVASGTAVGSGVDLMTAVSDMKLTTNTAVACTLTTTAADLVLATGDALAIDFTGTLTAATGVVTVLITTL